MFTLMTALLLSTPSSGVALELPRLKVSDNHRSLVTTDNKPFFYLADTGWELFHRLNREEAEKYLKKRAEQGFTVIQSVVLAEFDGLTVPNAFGHLPLRANDPTQPQEPYFEDVDWFVKKANELGLYVGMLPTWGDKVNTKWGGDRPVEKPIHLEIWKAMAAGLRAGDGGQHLVTYHPMGGSRSRQYFAGTDDVFDFHTQQNGHNIDTPVADRIARDYQATPINPILDMEPLYEGHPIDFKVKEKGHSNAADIRKFAYWSVFSGSCGHTYGHHSVWQFYTADRKPINYPIAPWQDAINAPGANQMKFLRDLIESKPYLTRVPAPELLVDASAGGKRLVATKDQVGTFAMIYSPSSRPIEAKTGLLSAKRLRVAFFDPRTGESKDQGVIDNSPGHIHRFSLPNDGENQDWVILLDAITLK